MRELPYSAFLKSILDRAAAFCDENMCSGITRDYIIVAALTILREADTEKPQTAEEEEYQETIRLLQSFDREQAKLNSVLIKPF